MKTKNLIKHLSCASMAVMICSSLAMTALASYDDIQPSPNTDVEIVMGVIPCSLRPHVEGGRETTNPVHSETLERVWGWSTLVDSGGRDVRHKTTAQYEGFGNVIGSQSNWGYGQVWAYSDWVSYNNVAQYYKAKVYYDY